MVAAGDNEHVSDEFRGNWCAGLVFLVHTGVWKARYYGCDPARRGRLTGGNEDKEFHEVVVDIVAPRLNDEHILVAHRLGYFDIDLAVGELFNGDGYEGDVKPIVRRRE